MEKLLDVIFGKKGDERRIGIFATGIVVLITLATGVVVFNIFARQVGHEMENGLVRTLNDREKLFHAVLEERIGDAVGAARLPHLVQLMAHASEEQETLRKEIEGVLVSNKLSALSLHDAQGKVLAAFGSFVARPEMAAPLKHSTRAALLWQGQYYLHVPVEIRNGGQLLGTMQMEMRLPRLSAIAVDFQGLGETGEMVVCAPSGADRMQCFPSRHQRKPFTLPKTLGGRLLPLSLALAGQSGYAVIQDYRRMEVFDAYKPLGDTGLGMVVKIDTREMDQQVRQQLLWGAPLLVALAIGGIVLLRWRVTPMVREVVASKAGLKAAHDEMAAGHAALLESNRALEAAQARATRLEEEQDQQMDALAEANVRMVIYHASMEALREADADLMGGNGGMEVFCKKFLANAMALCGAKYGAVGLFSQEGQLHNFFTEGISAEERQKIGHLPSGKGLLHAFYQEDRTVRVGDISADPRSCGFPPNHPPMKSLLGVPLMSAGAKKGVVYLADKNGGEPFTGNDELLMDMMVMEAGHILHRHDLLTRLRAANVALERERGEQKALITQLNEAQSQLLHSEKMASIGQLAAGVAHEINNPIGFVYSNLGTLEKYLDDMFAVLDAYEQAQGDAGKLSVVEALKKKVDIGYVKEDLPSLMHESRDGITRVKKIVQNLKDFSHVDTSDEWQWASLHQGLDSTLNIVWNEIKYKAEVNKKYGEIPDIQCLPSELNQVFMNMLVNAAHAIEERGVITVRTGQEGGQAWVEFADNGKGIAEENLKRIFDPFFTTKPVGKGTGLGLSLSYSIVQKHHGYIEVSSEVGKGTTFRIWLPVTQAGEVV